MRSAAGHTGQCPPLPPPGKGQARRQARTARDHSQLPGLWSTVVTTHCVLRKATSSYWFPKYHDEHCLWLLCVPSFAVKWDLTPPTLVALQKIQGDSRVIPHAAGWTGKESQGSPSAGGSQDRAGQELHFLRGRPLRGPTAAQAQPGLRARTHC